MQFLRIFFLFSCLLFIVICINAVIYTLVGKIWLEFLIGIIFIAIVFGLSYINHKFIKARN